MKIHHFIFSLSLLICGCEKQAKYCPCECKNSAGAIIIDTVFHTTQDEAYQLCEGLESNPNVDNCQSFE